MSVFTVRIWGARGSIPTPGPKTLRYGGNTACVELRRGETLFILDAGTGIRELGDEIMRERAGRPFESCLFVTHTHWDHIQGFPFFVPAYVPGNRLRIYGAHGVNRSFETVFRGLMDSSYFPVNLGDMAASIEFVEVRGEPFACGGVEVRTTFTNHPGVDVAYRFAAEGKTVTYLTDHEALQTMTEATEFARNQDRLIEDFCRGSDILICDAQYTDEDYRTKRAWGHSRYKDAVSLGLRAEVKRLVLFHHDPAHGDDQLDAIGQDAAQIVRRSGSPMECILAEEGLRLDV